MYYLNDILLSPNKGFTDADGNQYPADWLKNSTQEQRDALGIVYVAPPAPEYYNPNFYYSTGVEKDLDYVKNTYKGRSAAAINQFLANTDWYVTRAADTGKPVPDEVTVFRASVRTVYDAQKAEIDACASIAELEALITNGFTNPWPELGAVTEYPDIDYRGFYNGLLVSAVYQTIRAQAVTTPAVTVACTEFIAAIADAKSGRPLVAAIQSCINLLIAAVTLTTEETAELQGLMDAFSLSPTLTLP
jgi:hypothetical protein